jgi:signal transduction histidine kinase
MARTNGPFRRRSLHIVIVLLVFYPIGLYVYTRSVNQAAAENIVRKNIDSGLRYCGDVKGAIEELLARQEEHRPQYYDPLEAVMTDVGRSGFERHLQRLLYTDDVTHALISSTEVYDGDQCILQWGQDPPGRIIEEIAVEYPIDYPALRQRVFVATEGGSRAGVCRISMPVELGGQRRGRLVVGLASSNIGNQLGALSEQLSTRALRLSLVGTSLLALLAAYIVYLNDRTGELERKLEEEKRLAYVGTIAAGVAHEIRNPLNSVKMNIQMIENRLGELDRDENHYVTTKVARIHRETARLEESVNNFLAFARPKPLQRRRADLNQATDHVVEFLEPACLNDDIRIVRDYTDGLPPAYIDPDQLGQAVENLVRNAHQAIGENGTIEIYTGRHDDHLEVRVSDDGPGIPPEAQEKLFDIFYTTKEGGSGLGLTIVKQIVEAHGGAVSFDTIEKRGTTFTIALPLSESR